uniref:NYN domain-containing protein n=1 Tax=Oryza glumipatula TaxID=40148 RepID=A0A0D9ZFN0_9ORYZ
MVGSAAYSAASAIVVVMAKGKGRGGRGGPSGANKDYERRQTSGPQPATRYRKKKVIKEVLPDDTDFYEDASSTLHYTNQGLEIASPVILVDGYNVCGYWGKLKKDFMNGRQEIARQMLIDELVSFSAVREIKVVVVFDAAASGLSTHKETYKGVDVVYSGDLSADSWIEKEVEALVADGCPKVWVVTSDALEQQLAHGEIKESEKELDEELKETRSTSLQGKLFQHKLKPKVVHALKDLRNKLEEEERRKR